MDKCTHWSGDTITNRISEENWKVVMVDDEHNQLIITHDTEGLRVVNITNLEVDYIILDKHE